jgi:hypothetical protein
MNADPAGTNRSDRVENPDVSSSTKSLFNNKSAHGQLPDGREQSDRSGLIRGCWFCSVPAVCRHSPADHEQQEREGRQLALKSVGHFVASRFSTSQ